MKTYISFLCPYCRAKFNKAQIHWHHDIDCRKKWAFHIFTWGDIRGNASYFCCPVCNNKINIKRQDDDPYDIFASFRCPKCNQINKVHIYSGSDQECDKIGNLYIFSSVSKAVYSMKTGCKKCGLYFDIADYKEKDNLTDWQQELEFRKEMKNFHKLVEKSKKGMHERLLNEENPSK